MCFKLRCILLQLVCCLSIVLSNYHQSSSKTTHEVVTTTVLPVGYIYYQNINAALKVHLDRSNWSNAKQKCISEGGRLAVIDTQEKLGYVKANKPRFSDVWVGIVRENHNWVTVDNHSRLSNLPWERNRPDWLGDCTAVNVKGNGLTNKICIWRRAFVCEILTSSTTRQQRTLNQVRTDRESLVFE